jgi:hypothetical protein
MSERLKRPRRSGQLRAIPPGSDRDVLIFRPRPDTAASSRLAAVRPGRRRCTRPRPAGVLDEGRELAAEHGRVVLPQADFILCRRSRTGSSHPPGLVKIVFNRDGYVLCHPRLPGWDRRPALYKINRHAAAIAVPPALLPSAGEWGSLCTFPVHVLVDQARHHQPRGVGLSMRRRGEHTPGCRACYSSFSGI